MNTLIILLSILGVTWLLGKIIGDATTNKIICIIALILIFVVVLTVTFHIKLN